MGQIDRYRYFLVAYAFEVNRLRIGVIVQAVVGVVIVLQERERTALFGKLPVVLRKARYLAVRQLAEVCELKRPCPYPRLRNRFWLIEYVRLCIVYV